MVSLVYYFWYAAEYYSVIYLYQFETYLSIKNYVFSFLKKAYFINVWGKIDESECYEKYERLRGLYEEILYVQWEFIYLFHNSYVSQKLILHEFTA